MAGRIGAGRRRRDGGRERTHAVRRVANRAGNADRHVFGMLAEASVQHQVVAQVVNNSEALLRGVSVDVKSIPRSIYLPEASFAAWNAIFQNVLINAVNAMIESEDRRIFCFGEAQGKKRAIYVSDTGVGVDLVGSHELFKPFIRRLEIPEERKALGLGGMGMGLTIVKMVADSVGCNVYFVEPVDGYSTSFKLEWEES